MTDNTVMAEVTLGDLEVAPTGESLKEQIRADEEEMAKAPSRRRCDNAPSLLSVPMMLCRRPWGHPGGCHFTRPYPTTEGAPKTEHKSDPTTCILEGCTGKVVAGTFICADHFESFAPTVGRGVVVEGEQVEGEQAEPEANDPVHRPKGYTKGPIECIDALGSALIGLEGVEAFCAGNVLTYIWRHNEKNGNEDLDKAKWYIERLKLERAKRGAK